MGVTAATARFRVFEAQLKRVEQTAIAAAKATEKATDALTTSDQVLEKIRRDNLLGGYIDQFLELAEAIRKTPMLGTQGGNLALSRMETFIRQIAGAEGSKIDFNALRTGRTKLRAGQRDSGIPQGFLDLMKKMGMLGTR